MQSIFSIGVFVLLEDNNNADETHMIILLVGMVSFIVGTIFVAAVDQNIRINASSWYAKPIEGGKIEGKTSEYIIWLIIIVSILIGIAYYLTVGYNLIYSGMSNMLTDGRSLENVGSKRLEFYGGEKYFAPGYVNQFKNILLPVLTGYLYIRSKIYRQRNDYRPIIVLLALSAIFFLVMTGQRAPIFYATLTFSMFSIATLQKHDVKKILIPIVITFVAFFLITTLILGRGGIDNVSNADDFYLLIMQLPERLFSINQGSSVYGFRYIYTKDIELGAEWLKQLAMLMPGKGGITIENELYALYTGTTRGTAPLSIWGSIWYSFGLMGVISIPFFMGILYQKIFHKLIRGRKNIQRIMIYNCLTVILGMWVAGSPIWLANNGLLTIIILAVLLKKSKKIIC